jgi:hypothetical protein
MLWRLPVHTGAAVPFVAVVRVDLVNGRRLWLLEVVEDDDRWLRGTNSRGRSVLLMRERVKQLEPN